MQKGKLVVIEGTDGSGKGTQLELLINYFKAQHIRYSTLDFPQYHKTIFGKWIGQFLRGDYGTVEEITPYLVMFPYAADRWTAKKGVVDALEDGKIVVSNRYAPSNAYQSAKLPEAKRKDFYTWCEQMEYEGFGIPREDLVIFLYVPYDVSQKLIALKKDRKYLGKGKKDIHESNEKLMRTVEKEYLMLAKTKKHWVKIDCSKNGQILSKDEIHQKVIETLKKKKIV